MNEKFSKLGFYPSDILLPKKDVDMSKWAVVACDQFTSEPEYWERVEKTVGDAPSTLRLILPEANLKAPNVDEFIADINASMSKYLEEGIFETLKDSLIYIERGQSDGKIRHGLIGMVDLDQYDFTPGSGALIRATEGTVLDRIPPRARVRRNAPIELPHVMLLIDDPDKTVIEPLTAAAGTLIAYGAALITARSNLGRGYKRTIESIALVTNAIPGMVLGVAYLFLFSGTSLQNTLLLMVLCNIVHYFSTPYLMMKNALSKMNAGWETTAMLMGDSWLKTILRVVTPNALSSLIEVFSYYFINSMVTISALIFIAGARTMVLTTMIKQLQYVNRFNEVFVLSLLILATNLAAKALFSWLAGYRSKHSPKITKKEGIK